MPSESLPKTMRAIVVAEDSGQTTLKEANVDVPRPGEGQILIKVEAAGINRTDLRREQSHFKVSGPIVAGLEVAGEICEVGSGVTEFSVGDRVAAMAPGGYAEYAVADEISTLALPDGVSSVDGAALATWYMTAHNALVSAGQFKKGDTVLVTAATSGIGMSVLQVARALGASKVIGSCRNPAKQDAFKALGWDALIGSSPDEIQDGVDKETENTGVDVVIDMVGAGLINALIQSTSIGGHIVSVGRLAGFDDQIDLDKLALRRVSLVGVTFRTRSREEKRAVRDDMMRDLKEPLMSGKIKPIVDSTFPLEMALAAQEYMAENRHLGKVVLTV